MKMQIKTQNPRIPWIDIAKGYGTILVIYAHLGVGTLWTWIYSFHLPLFFFLSGYVFSTKYDFKNFIARKCKSILVPYVCLGVPMVLFELLKYWVQERLTWDAAVSLLKAFVLQQRFWTLWFMACLFCLNILFYLLVIVCKKEWLLVVVSIVLPLVGLAYYKAGETPLFWNADVCVMAIPFFTVGYLYKLHAKRIDGVIDKACWSIPLFVVCAIMNVIAWRLSLDENGIGLEMFASNYGNPVFTYIAAFAGIFCVVILSKWFTIKQIRYIGENSMIYYAWHQTIMIPVIAKLFSMIGLDALNGYGDVGVVVYKWLSLIGIVVVLTICNWCIGKLGLKFVVGK